MSIVVTSDNFGLIAARYYDDISATDLEFQEDLRRFSMIKRLLNVYNRTGQLKERLILNHLIVIFNVFGPAAAPLLFYELREYLTILVPFLVAINRLPPKVGELHTSSIPLDPKVVECLRKNFR